MPERAIPKREKNKEGRALFLVGSGLIKASILSLLSATDTPSINKSTVVGMLVNEKIKKDAKSYLYLTLVLILHIALAALGVMEQSAYFMAFILVMISALMINQKVLEYRIRVGLYGTTQYEAREIIKYAEDHSNPDDFNDGEKRRKVFQDAVQETTGEVVVYGGAINGRA